MKIQTGRGEIPLIIVIAIWSISAVISLPGLAVSPILGDLDKIFTKVSDLEIQMLTAVPSLLIIPFVLLSGKLAEGNNQIRLLRLGLLIFFIAGILYFFANSITQLIIISCILGVGAGLIVPLSTGLIVQRFFGKYRIEQLGVCSAINNLTLVIATMVTGYLANINWHLPFIVYTLPLGSLILSWWLSPVKSQVGQCTDTAKDCPVTEPKTASEPKTLDKKRLAQLMIFYFFITYCVLSIPFYLPFMAQKHNIDSGTSGIMISLFFLAIMSPGFFINKVVGVLRSRTNYLSLALITVGLLLLYIFRSERGLLMLGCILTGFGYGIMQPIIYDKTASIAPEKKSTLALAFVMSVNYLAIVICPFIVSAIMRLLGITIADDHHTPFLLSTIFAAIVAFWSYRRQSTFIFGSDKDEYQSSTE